jgi:hypothetical protein
MDLWITCYREGRGCAEDIGTGDCTKQRVTQHLNTDVDSDGSSARS